MTTTTTIFFPVTTNGNKDSRKYELCSLLVEAYSGIVRVCTYSQKYGKKSFKLRMLRICIPIMSAQLRSSLDEWRDGTTKCSFTSE